MAKRTSQNDYFNNIRDQQIGGLTDGITPEVATDIGYETGPADPDRVAKLRGALENLGGIATASSDQDDAIAKGRKLAKDIVVNAINPEGRSPAAWRRQKEIDAADILRSARTVNRRPRN